VKRLFDFVLASLGLIVLSPVISLVAVLIRFQIGHPILFKQQRPGLHGKPFCLVKFRTMLNASGPDGILLPDAARLTNFGRVLRLTSLDELPELWNVLWGDMSLVGPRPLLMEYLPRYSPEQARRHDVRPGITGWAQVNGRNSLSWKDKFSLDVWYVDHRSFWLDLKILGMTIWSVIARHGISADDHATMPPFLQD
jgi:lipopolysaccharide/colanic/teichoic acid biosynthesis glycosyltransferase